MSAIELIHAVHVISSLVLTIFILFKELCVIFDDAMFCKLKNVKAPSIKYNIFMKTFIMNIKIQLKVGKIKLIFYISKINYCLD